MFHIYNNKNIFILLVYFTCFLVSSFWVNAGKIFKKNIANSNDKISQNAFKMQNKNKKNIFLARLSLFSLGIANLLIYALSLHTIANNNKLFYCIYIFLYKNKHRMQNISNLYALLVFVSS